MMPGMGLTAIGLAGVTISYAGVAHTFVDGMHALTGLTMFVGLIFLSCGILEGGVSTSNRAKATTLVVISIALAFGAFTFTQNAITTLPTFTGLMLIITVPAIVIAYVAMKMPKYLKPVAGIFILAAGAGIIAFVTFGVYGPSPYLLPPEIEEATEEIPEAPAPTVQVFAISILEGSSEQGKPDYDPDVANVPKGHVVEWTNNDSLQHTVTSSIDFGETFDSGLLDAGEKFLLDTSKLAIGEYEYMCIVHPWMTAMLIVEEPKEAVAVQVSIPKGAALQQPGQQYYDPDLVTVSVETKVVWANNDDTIHTVTAGNPTDGPSGVFDSDLISAGQSFEYTFNTAGTFDYYCIVHPWMEGTVIAE
jgi:plastocyanin